MKIYIRGALGTQFLSIFFLMSNKEVKVDEIVLSAGGGSLAEHCKILYVPEYMSPRTELEYQIDNESTHKTFNVNNWPEMSVDEYKDRWDIFNSRWSFVRYSLYPKNVIIHARGTDNKFLTDSMLTEIANRFDEVCVTGEDKELLERIPAKNISSDNPVGDWMALQNAKEVHGGCSTFMLSAAMLAPDTEFVFYQTPDMNPNSKIISDRIVSVLDNARIECFGH